MMTEYKWRHLISWLKDYYIFEYTDIDPNFKNEMIDYIVTHNADVFTKEDVMSFDGCIQCGLCCKQMDCPHWDSDTKLCTTHDDLPWEICKTAPYGDPDFGLMLNFGVDCSYLLSFLINYLNNVFEQKRKMEANNGE